MSWQKHAYIRSFDGKVQPDYVGVADELTHRGFTVVKMSDEEFLAGHFSLTRNDIVVGDFLWTRAALARLGVAMPAPPDYPESLAYLLGRRVWTSTLAEVREKLAAMKNGPAQDRIEIFIKPAEDTKAFAGIIEPRDQMLDALLDGIPGVLAALPPSFRVHCSEVVEMLSEYRVYVVRGDIRGTCHYKGPEDPARYALDGGVVRAAVARLYAPHADGTTFLAGCALDFCVVRYVDAAGAETFRTSLVEVNDGVSLGLYAGLSAADYTDLLQARWAELMA